MKNKKMIESWSKIKRNDVAHDRILNGILERVHSDESRKLKRNTTLKPRVMKPMITVVCILVLVGTAVFASGVIRNRLITELPTDSMQSLWNNRKSYVGDNGKVGGIIDGFFDLERLERKGFELFTTTKPYGLEVKYNADETAYEDYKDDSFQTAFQFNALLAFCLIDNADYVNFSISNGNDDYTVKYTREWADEVTGRDIREYANKDFDTFKAFVEETSTEHLPSGDSEPVATNNVQENEEVQNDDLVTIRIDMISSTKLSITYTNNTDKELAYGKAYVLQRLNNDKWEDIPLTVGFNDIGLAIGAGKSVKETIDLKINHDKLIAGHYRIVKEMFEPDKYHSTKMDVIGEFDIIHKS